MKDRQSGAACGFSERPRSGLGVRWLRAISRFDFDGIAPEGNRVIRAFVGIAAIQHIVSASLPDFTIFESVTAG